MGIRLRLEIRQERTLKTRFVAIIPSTAPWGPNAQTASDQTALNRTVLVDGRYAE